MIFMTALASNNLYTSAVDRWAPKNSLVPDIRWSGFDTRDASVEYVST